MMGKRRVAHAMRLRRSNVGAIVRSGSIHGDLVGRRATGLVAGGSLTLADEPRCRLARLGGVARMRRNVARGSTTSVGGKTTLTLLNLALNAATIRGLADRRQDGAHDLDKMQTQFRRGELERSLDNIVAIRVAHELLELLSIKEFLDEQLLGRHLSTTNALLDDV